MPDRPASGEQAVLVHLGVGRAAQREDTLEFEDLARSAGVNPLLTVTGKRRAPDARLFVGTGKAEEIRTQVSERGADLVLVNHDLSPSQERNLERALSCRVLDRSGLILDIFAQRARSFEGKLQVELAQLEHLSTRLVRGWTHLERQKGGIGLRGPGETQLETDRRLIGRRIRHLQMRIEKLRAQRGQRRRNRQRAEVPVVSLVGYTNAGKSTLFNQLTGSAVHAADQLFATLDPTLRRLRLPNGRQGVLVDTVGFIKDLPHELVAAFRATLEETREADLILHVVDASDPHRAERTEEVEKVLEDIGADRVPQIRVLNKTDLIDGAAEPPGPRRVPVSALTGAGLDRLGEAIAAELHGDLVRRVLRLHASEGRIRAELYARGAVREEAARDDGGWDIDVEMSGRALGRICGTVVSAVLSPDPPAGRGLT
ncbi:MAG TPA: ribosome rescue GTPase HflX [Gammaproteobacteria bacterium]|nr:ribosome rescue GTPase HflX [Gammaproteobacteria bacterium]